VQPQRTGIARGESFSIRSGVEEQGPPLRLPSQIASALPRLLREGEDFCVFRGPAAVGGRRGGGCDAPPPSSANVACEAADLAGTASRSSLAELLAAISEEDGPQLVLLGEVHNDAAAHLLQLEVLRGCADMCHAWGRRLVLSLEMFEIDVQRVLDEYVLLRAVREADMLQDARPWGNYAEHYRPLVEFCRERGLRVVAANAPRRYTAKVAREGSAALQQLLAEDAPQIGIPPLPLPAPSAAYAAKFRETIAAQMPAHGGGAGGCPFIGFRGGDVRETKPEILEAQLLWDHTMASSIARSLRRLEGEVLDPLVIHICGAFHSAHGLGIPEALPRYWSASGSPAVKAGPSAGGGLHREGDAAWLPVDDTYTVPSASALGERVVSVCPPPVDEGSAGNLGPKCLPAGVLSVVSWPGSVRATLELAHSGATPRSLALLGNFVVVTEETYGEEVLQR